MQSLSRTLVALVVLGFTTPILAFSAPTRFLSPALTRPVPAMAPGAAAGVPLMPLAATPMPRAAMRRVPAARMGLFGLGWAEIGVIGVLALLFFGPEKLAPLAKDLGKSASGLKEVTDSFAEGMSEGTTGVSKDGGEQAIKSAAAEDTTTP